VPAPGRHGVAREKLPARTEATVNLLEATLNLLDVLRARLPER
jgi:hypothetical protein